MASGNYFDWDPIHDDDDVIRSALEHANAPVTLAALVHLTGDVELLRGDIRVDHSRARDLQCGISTEQQAIVRTRALEVLADYRDRGCPAPPRLATESLREILRFITGQELDEDCVRFLIEESEFENDDAYGVGGFDTIPADIRHRFHVVVVGAGMSGLLAGYRLKQAGLSFTIVERSSEVGGTWHENVYPGCRVDNPSHVYEYSFARHDWPQYYCAQPVLKSYFERCASDFGLRPHILFEREVVGADFDEASGTWDVTLQDRGGTTTTLKANALICATGQLNQPRLPDLDGVGAFEGPAFHSARWDSTLDLSGKRVAVIGTGATAMQFVPEIARQAGEVIVFQRTPPWIYPSPDYRASVPAGEHWLINHVPYYARWYHFLLFWLDGEGLYASVTKDPAWPHQERSVSAANDALRKLMIRSIQRELDGDEELIAASIPKHPPCGKRLLLDDGTWYRTLRRDNVQLVTETIDRIAAGGVLTTDGVEHSADVLVYATGFHASRFLWPMRIRGRDRRDIREHWGDDPRAYLGIVVPGYPNLFCLYGPNTNIVITGSTIFFSECGMHYVMGCIRMLFENGYHSLECRKEVHDAYNVVIDEGNLQVAWGAPNVRSWYKNKAGRVTQNWPFKLLEYWNRTRTPDQEHFHFS